MVALAWDPNERWWTGARVERAGAWLRGQGVAQEVIDETRRVDFRVEDGQAVADLFTYATNENGARYYDPATDEAAMNPEPVTVKLGALPPAELRPPHEGLCPG
jgi:heme-binding NEAT domain protein